jgi:two-component system chemotaxis response regulator CheB
VAQIRTLVIDETIRWREVLRSVLTDVRDIQLVGVTPRVSTGLTRIKQDQPDLVVLSVDSPDFTSADVIRKLLADHPDIGIVLTTHSESEAADRVIEALGAGAFDFVIKADDSNGEASLPGIMGRRLLPKIRTFSAARFSRKARGLSPSPRSETGGTSAATAERAERRIAKPRRKRGVRPPQVLVIGISTGGPEALSRLLPEFPASFPVPMVIVQHMPSQFISSLATALDRTTKLSVREAEHGITLLPGTVYIARGGKHLHLARNAYRQLALRESDSPPENGFRPSADNLFRSAARFCGGAVVALIMTGMGDDGAKGLGDLKRAEAFILAQDEESSVVWGMPGEAVRGGLVDEVLPLDEMAERVMGWVNR